MRRSDICLYLSPADRTELQTLITNRNTPRKFVWGAEIILATRDGHDIFELMRRTRTSKPTVWRWWERYLTKGFKVSNDPMFDENLTDIVGLYLDPPDRAVVLCVDEKSQI